ncbi:MAG: AMP-binding protein [Bacteroidota bacterium]
MHYAKVEKTNRYIHRTFSLNGFRHDVESLREVAYSLIKEGEDFERSMGDFLLDWLDDSPTLTVSTSGSTGSPKKMLLQKTHMRNSALATGNFLDLSYGDSALLCLPLDYIAGKMMLVRAMVWGLALDYVAPSSHPLSLTQKSYDFCAMIPMQLKNTLSHLERVKTIIVGGAPVSSDLQARIPQGKNRIFETYGMTETVSHVAARLLNPDTDSMAISPKNPSFKALPEVTFSTDKRNCLVLSAPSVSETEIVTNDIVNLISPTEFQWLGRLDNIINSGGIKLVPEQIEAKLSALLDTRFFVAGVPDADLGQKVILVLEGEGDTDDILERIRTSGTLDSFEIPKKIYGIPKFALTETGKIHRKRTLGMRSK